MLKCDVIVKIKPYIPSPITIKTEVSFDRLKLSILLNNVFDKLYDEYKNNIINKIGNNVFVKQAIIIIGIIVRAFILQI